MEPITFTAIAAALATGAGPGAAHVAVTEAYDALKSRIFARHGSDSDIAKAIESAEKHPDSRNYTNVLQEEIQSAALDADEEIRQQAQELSGVLESHGVRVGDHKQEASGNFNAVASTGGEASVNVSSSDVSIDDNRSGRDPAGEEPLVEE